MFKTSFINKKYFFYLNYQLMMNLFKNYFIILFLFLFSTRISGQPELNDLSLSDLFDIKTSSATGSAQSISEAPAIIDVITREDIKKHRYSSVIEAVNDLPGFHLTTNHVNENLSLRGINSGMRSGSRNIKIMINGQSIL